VNNLKNQDLYIMREYELQVNIFHDHLFSQ